MQKTIIERKDGKLVLNPIKNAVRDFTLELMLPPPTPIATNNAIIIPALTQTAPLIITIPSWCHFEAVGLMGRAVDGGGVDRSNLITMTLETPDKWNPYWEDEHMLQNVMGTAQRPFIFPHSCLWNKNSTLTVRFRNLHVAPVTVSIAFPGRAVMLSRINKADLDALIDFVAKDYSGLAFYTTRGGMQTLPTLAVDVPTFVDINSARHFELHKRNATIERGIATTLCAFKDEDGYDYTNNYRTPPNDNVVFGTGQFPYILFEPTVITRTKNIELKWTNLFANTNRVAVSLIGRSLAVGYEDEKVVEK